MLWSGVLALLGSTVIGLLIVASGSTTTIEVPSSVSQISETDHVKGTRDASVVLIEYSDFECPACASYASLLDEVMDEFDNHVAFAYRHFPLDIHDKAKPAVRAAEAAGLQGKFWEMHDMLFENQRFWESATDVIEPFTAYAKTIGLDEEKFLNDYDSSALKNFADDAESAARDLDLTYTPTIILNGEVINNPGSYDEFRSIIRDAIESASQPAI